MKKNEKKLKPAVFIDRDGTISPEVGYINHEDRFSLLPKTARAIKYLNDNKLLSVVCTNQAGVARGYFEEKMIKKVHAKMKKLLKEKNAYVDDINYCPHHPQVGNAKYRKKCDCRKPGTLMLEESIKKHKVSRAVSYVIGDKMSDMIWGHKAGMKSVMVMTGYGKGEYTYQRKTWKDKPEYIAEDLLDAVKWIVKDLKKNKIK
ncbi:D-glycero-alpha-D-manno-heptose-1,7-bisphosphate 7-phosphatase [bacterium]